MPENDLTKLFHSHCIDCFHLHITRLSPECQTDNIDDTTLKQYIRHKIDACENNDVHFSWQDGELSSGRLHFFIRVIELQQQFAQGKNITNTLIINGVTLDDDWCEFFKKNHFLICISVDGDSPAQVNFSDVISETTRKNIIEKNVRLLQKHNVSLPHPYGDVYPLLLQAGDRQAGQDPQRDMRIFRPKAFQARQQPVASKRWHHRQRQLLVSRLHLHKPGGICDMVQRLAYL